MFPAPSNQSSQTTHSLISQNLGPVLTVQIKHTFLSMALSCRLLIHGSSAPYQTPVAQFKEKLNKMSGGGGLVWFGLVF